MSSTVLLTSLLLGSAFTPVPECSAASRAALHAEPVALEASLRLEDERVRVVETAYDLQFESIEATMNGGEVPAEFLPELEIEGAGERRLVVRDAPVGAAAGDGLLRSYEEVEGTESIYVAMGGEISEDEEASASSVLAGEDLRFERQGDAFVARPEAALAERLPDDLRFDLDLAGLLPDEPVAVGDEWSAPAAALDALRDPCGPGFWEWSADLSGERQYDEVEEPTGTLDLTFESWVPEHEGRLARLTLTGGSSEGRTRPHDLEEIPVAEGPGTEAVLDTVDWRGEVVWDVVEGRLHSADLTGDLTSESTVATTDDNPGPSFSSTVVLVGEIRLRSRVEAE